MAAATVTEPLYADRLIDAHCHLASTHFTPREFLRGAALNLVAQTEASTAPLSEQRALDLYLAANQDHEGLGLLAEMDAAGIAKSVLLLPDFTYVLPSRLTIAEMFERHAAVLAAHPGRFEVFAGADPRWGDDGITLFERGVRELGFRGLKLYPPCGYRLGDRALYPYYEICAANRIPVLAHMGPTSPALAFEPAMPMSVDRAALDFPNVRFILAHATHDPRQCALLCAYRPNVFADISGFQSMQHPSGWMVGLRELFALGINHKLIYGTDWPVFRAQGSHKRLLRAFLGPAGPLAEVPPAQRRWLMSANIERLLPPARADCAREEARP